MLVGFFIEPTGPLLERILAEKQTIGLSFPNAIYLHHPPHLTLLTAQHFTTEDLQTFDLSSSAQVSSFPVHIKRPFVFSNDTLASGGHTAVYLVEPSSALSSLQKTLATWVKGIHKKKNTRFDEQRFSNQTLQKSYLEYGFPFIGEHWIPHFTAASLPALDSQEYLHKFSNSVINESFWVEHFSLWEISDDTHRKIKEIKLAAVTP